MIEYSAETFRRVIKATCDCCGEEIKKNMIGQLEDHLVIGGHEKGKLLDAVVCLPCVEEKMSFINIQRINCTIGYC